MKDFFFDNNPEASVIADFQGKIILSNKKMKELFGNLATEGQYLDDVVILSSTSQNIFGKALINSYFEFEFENREVTHSRKDGFTFHFLLSVKKVIIHDVNYLFLSFKNVTDFVSYKNIFEELYDSLSQKTIELDNVISEKEKAYKLLKQKDDEMLRQLNLANEVQKSIFPEHNELFNKYSIYSKSKAASIVSGDFFYIWKSDDRFVDFIIADVTGHGVPSALITMMLKMSLQTRIVEYSKPELVLEALNSDMHGVLSNAMIFVTLQFSRIDTHTGEVHIINCGHTPPILLKKSGELKELDINGMMLGVVNDLDFGTLDIKMEDEDLLILITDGITEAQNPKGEFYGNYFYEKLKSISNESPEVIIDETFLGLYRFTQKDDFNDDVTMICVKKNL
ncbi:MAG TPA: SpoIIE family protein phosphatase [Spirochaetota bacterium]|nr:SpoIIE family protein phosphatase [Spirochaetota bacterium]